MSAKTRNWIFAAIGIAVFILGTPLAQRAIAGGNASGKAAHSHEAGAADVHLVKVGDLYLYLTPAGDGSLNAVLLDSAHKLVAVNENQAELVFKLPNGQSRSVRITAPSMSSTCTHEGHDSAGTDCCPDATPGAHEECEHERQSPETKENV
jgi:hypothetical protein